LPPARHSILFTEASLRRMMDLRVKLAGDACWNFFTFLNTTRCDALSHA
jgi:hypothetical protein